MDTRGNRYNYTYRPEDSLPTTNKTVYFVNACVSFCMHYEKVLLYSNLVL